MGWDKSQQNAQPQPALRPLNLTPPTAQEKDDAHKLSVNSKGHPIGQIGDLPIATTDLKTRR